VSSFFYFFKCDAVIIWISGFLKWDQLTGFFIMKWIGSVLIQKEVGFYKQFT